MDICYCPKLSKLLLDWNIFREQNKEYSMKSKNKIEVWWECVNPEYSPNKCCGCPK